MSESKETGNPSVHEANKALRVLTGKRLKYTLRLHLPDGKVTEWQSDKTPSLDWDNNSRSVWLVQRGSDYSNVPLMQWVDGAVLLVEENDK